MLRTNVILHYDFQRKYTEGNFFSMKNKKSVMLDWLYKFESSQMSVVNFFKNYKVPFSRSCFFKHKKDIKKNGIHNFLIDQKGGHHVIDQEGEKFLKLTLNKEPSASLSFLQKNLKEKRNCELSISGISRAIKRLGISKKTQLSIRKTTVNPLGGFELIIALAYHLGWPQRIAKLILQSINDLRKSPQYKKNKGVDKIGRNASGRFTKRYNQRKDVRVMRFQSVSKKRALKNWQSMNLIRDSPESIMRKCLAVLALPVLTSNGNVRSVNLALGQSLKHVCGYDYKQSTIARFLSELKYLNVSTVCLREVTEFWIEHWKQKNASETQSQTLCYYVDGNTKAVWSSQRVKQNKVTMLGRVMGCLEQVFIHDGWGHPVYFETFSGHAPVGEHILGLFEKIEDAILEMPRTRTRIFRSIVMDSASNSVGTLRSFASQNQYHYITPLDDNQFKERQIVKKDRPSRYRYREATLTELIYELEDSNEKGYLVRTRAIKIDWDNGKVTVLLTSLPQKNVDASEVVYSYFKRWPAQELQFKENKSVVSFNRVAGYGRQSIENKKASEQQKKTAEKIEILGLQLHQPLEDISFHEGKIARLIKEERKIKQKSKLNNGKPNIPIKYRTKFSDITQKIKIHQKEVKEIEKRAGKALTQFRKQQKKWLRLTGKEIVYELDVELDQIMTFHRVSLANLYSYFIKHFLTETSMSMAMLTHRLIHLNATIEETKQVRHIILDYNKKDPSMMSNLSMAIDKLNKLKIVGQQNKIFQFSIVNK